MRRREINVKIDKKLASAIDKGQIVRIIRRVLDAEHVMFSLEVGLRITDDRAVQQLNKDYRGKDKTTDVLSFHMVPQTSIERGELQFVIPTDEVCHLGDVVISYPQAVRQAKENKWTIDQELALLVIHGVLHLLGYDHKRPDEKQTMETKEREILKNMTFPDRAK